MLYEFKLGNIAIEVTKKNICYIKGESAVDYRIVTRWLKKFCSGYKNLDNQKNYRGKSGE